MKWSLIGIVLFDLLVIAVAQHVAPGVPPQQYVSELHSVMTNLCDILFFFHFRFFVLLIN